MARSLCRHRWRDGNRRVAWAKRWCSYGESYDLVIVEENPGCAADPFPHPPAKKKKKKKKVWGRILENSDKKPPK